MSLGNWKHTKPETVARRGKLEQSSERRKRVQDLARNYLDQTGMALADFAHRVGYGYSTVHKFLADRYEHVGGDDSAITAAILGFMERYPIQSIEDFDGKLYAIGNVRVVREVFARALDRAHIFMLYGPPGFGKTYSIKGVIAEHNRAAAAEKERRQHIFHVYCRAAITPLQLARRIAQACGTSVAGDIDRVLRNLLWEFRGQRVVLVLDEAQHLALDCFEMARELFDQGSISLVFTGSHELDRIFRKFEGSLEQLQRRVTDRITLPGVTREEATGIIRSELACLVADIDDSLIQQQIELATVRVKASDRSQRYISIGRLTAALRETREAFAVTEDEPEPRAEVTQ